MVDRGDDGERRLAVASTIAALGDTLAEGGAVTLTRPAPRTGEALGHGMDGRERYEVIGTLGEGGMGRVERAWDGDLMRELAVKQLQTGLGGDARLVAQFLWEARVSAHLDHPNIVPVYDIGLTEVGELYFTMKRVRGRSFEEVIEELRTDAAARDRMGLMRRLRVLVQVCNAIQFAHSRGVLHRDLKPANVMLGEHGEVIVMDWGLAMPLEGPEGDALRELLPDEVAKSSSSGTPLYMSPEQARGAPLDERSDVFTPGVIMYERVALRSPYTATAVPHILAQVAVAEHVPLHEAEPAASPSVRAVVARAMASDPADRYPTVAALAEDIELVTDGRTPRAEDAPAVTRLARFYTGRSPVVSQMRFVDWELFVTGGILVGLGGGAALSGFLAGWWWAPVVAGALLWIPPTLKAWRLARAAE